MFIQRYCSLDLELTGLNPLEDEILEVGYGIFEVRNGSIAKIKTVNNIIQAEKKIHARITALTGLNETQQVAAVPLESLRAEMQSDLDSSILIGHGIATDRAFLEANNFSLPESSIDTLDLAQILLPTTAGYGLEALLRKLNIVHTAAHRALSDAESTFALLLDFYTQFKQLPQKIQKQILGGAQQFQQPWAGLFSSEIKNVSEFNLKEKENTKLPIHPEIKDTITEEVNLLAYPARTITQESLAFTQIPSTVKLDSYVKNLLDVTTSNAENTAPPSVAPTVTSALIVVPDLSSALLVSQHAYPILEPKHKFSPQRFSEFQNTVGDWNTQKFVLKILVWQTLFPEQKFVAQLNTSFFGGQFLPAITQIDDSVQQIPAQKCFTTTFSDLPYALEKLTTSKQKIKQIMFWNTEAFEEFLEKREQIKIGTSSLYWALRNDAYQTGISSDQNNSLVYEYAQSVLDVTLAVIRIQFQKYFPQHNAILFSEIFSQTGLYNQIVRSLQHAINKLENFYISSYSPNQLIEKLKQLLDLFQTQNSQNTINWVEVSQTGFTFVSRSKQLPEVMERYLAVKQKPIQMFHEFHNVTINFISTQNLLVQSYFGWRLHGSLINTAENTKNKKNKISSVFQHESLEKDIIQLYDAKIKTSAFSDFSHLTTPLLIVANSGIEAKLLYQKYENEFSHLGRVFVQGYSGGSRKTAANFNALGGVLIGGIEYIISLPQVLQAQTMVLVNLQKPLPLNLYAQQIAMAYETETLQQYQTVRNHILSEQLKNNIRGIEKIYAKQEILKV